MSVLMESTFISGISPLQLLSEALVQIYQDAAPINCYTQVLLSLGKTPLTVALWSRSPQ
jgi:hypothetical protein